jgi:hypothetical protein
MGNLNDQRRRCWKKIEEGEGSGGWPVHAPWLMRRPLTLGKEVLQLRVT